MNSLQVFRCLLFDVNYFNALTCSSNAHGI